MFKMNSRVDYGLLIMLKLAKTKQASLSSSQLSKSLGLSSAYLSQIAGHLVRAGLIASREGVKGGYSLSLRPEKINILMIIEALDGPLGVRCLSAQNPCKHKITCPASQAWSVVFSEIEKTLTKQTLAKLIK